MEKQNMASAQILRTALTKAETSHPGISFDIVQGIARKADVTVDMNETVLRLQGMASDHDGMYQHLS